MNEFDLLELVKAPVFALAKKKDGVFLAWNAALVRTSGIPRQTILGRRPVEVFGPEAAALTQLGGGGTGPVRIPGLGAIDLARRGGIILGTLNDHEREVYLGMAAHDLRAPLRNILFLSELATEDPTKVRELMGKIRKVARGGILLTNDVVSCSQASGVPKTRLERVRLKPLCHAVMASLDAEERHDLVVQDVTLQIEKTILQIVLRNLLDNALKHGGKAAISIQVTADYGPAGVTIGVRDNGKGFPDPARAFLAGGDFRVECGYGLVAIRRLVQTRGGGIRVETPKDGPGSLILVTLPGDILPADQVAIAS